MDSKTLEKIVGLPARFLSRPRSFTRNNVGFYKIGRRKVVVKEYIEDLFFDRERATYGLLSAEKLNLPPSEFFPDQKIAVIEYIESLPHSDIGLAIEDWARIHLKYKGSKSLPKRKAGSAKWARELIEVLRAEPEEFEGRARDYARFLEASLPILRSTSNKTLVHGDLRGTNYSTTTNGNFYYDFEFSGLGHPSEDVVPFLLEAPSQREEILRTYFEITGADPQEFKEAMNSHLVLRGSGVLLATRKRDISPERKSKIRKKFLRVMNQAIAT